MSDEPGTVADLIRTATEAVIDFRLGLGERPVARPVDRDALVAALGGPLPVDAAAPDLLINELVEAVEPGLVATAGPRFFGFVVGGSLPAATAADLLAVGWDQLAFNATTSPAASVVEQVAGGWLTSLLGLPATASVGFGTGAQSANTVGLAAGRHRVLDAAGWDVELDGLAGAPRLRVVASAERHATVDRSLRLLGLGARSIVEVAAGPQGAIDIADLGRVLDQDPSAPTILVLQSGNVNTGACDDLRAAIGAARSLPNCWVHVAGAFGLWAAASPATSHLVDGVELADSWCTDGHKWLNVPYDCGLVFCADPAVHAAAASYTAAYLSGAGAGLRGLGGPARTRLGRRRRPDRALLPAGSPVRRRARRGRRRDRERRRAEPGAGVLRLRRPHRRRRRGRAAGRYLLARRHHLARAALHAGVGLQLVHHGAARRPFGGRRPPRRRRAVTPC